MSMIIKLDIIHVSSFMGPQLVVLIYVHTVQGYMDLGGTYLLEATFVSVLITFANSFGPQDPALHCLTLDHDRLLWIFF